MNRRNVLAQTATAASGLALAQPASATWFLGGGTGSGLLTAWNGALTAAIATHSLGPTVAARALSMVDGRWSMRRFTTPGGL